jgi:hypothetical protein
MLYYDGVCLQLIGLRIFMKEKAALGTYAKGEGGYGGEVGKVDGK